MQIPAERGSDWLDRVKHSITVHDLAGAKNAIDARLAAEPNDSDALYWRARLFAWAGKRAEAEQAYHLALERSPQDADYLLGLARLLAQEGRDADALAMLDTAARIPPPRADVLSTRGRVLLTLGRRKEARADFLQARSLEPANISPADDEAAAGLERLAVTSALARFEIDLANETDTFNYIGAANAQSARFVARLGGRWVFSAEGDSYQRFASLAEKFIGAAAYRLDRSDSLTIAGGGGDAGGIIPRAEAYFEYGHGFRISERKPLRGIELAYNQHWLWYAGAHILVLSARGTANLARDFRWTVAAYGARSGFDGAGVDWKPSGYTRLDFPLPRVHADRLLLNAMFAAGSENFGEVDQVGTLASRTFGGGARLGLTPRQYFGFYAAKQFRDGGRTEMMYGASYGVRF